MDESRDELESMLTVIDILAIKMAIHCNGPRYRLSRATTCDSSLGTSTKDPYDNINGLDKCNARIDLLRPSGDMKACTIQRLLKPKQPAPFSP